MWGCLVPPHTDSDAPWVLFAMLCPALLVAHVEHLGTAGAQGSPELAKSAKPSIRGFYRAVMSMLDKDAVNLALGPLRYCVFYGLSRTSWQKVRNYLE